MVWENAARVLDGNSGLLGWNQIGIVCQANNVLRDLDLDLRLFQRELGPGLGLLRRFVVKLDWVMVGIGVWLCRRRLAVMLNKVRSIFRYRRVS